MRTDKISPYPTSKEVERDVHEYSDLVRAATIKRWFALESAE